MCHIVVIEDKPENWELPIDVVRGKAHDIHRPRMAIPAYAGAPRPVVVLGRKVGARLVIRPVHRIERVRIVAHD